MGERLHGMQEVSGSIPLSSTNFYNEFKGLPTGFGSSFFSFRGLFDDLFDDFKKSVLR